MACETFSECHFFYFYSNGTCQLYSGDTRSVFWLVNIIHTCFWLVDRSECGLIGGSPDQSLVQCLIDTDHGCDAFTDLECQYMGQVCSDWSIMSTRRESTLSSEDLNWLELTLGLYVYVVTYGCKQICKFFASEFGSKSGVMRGFQKGMTLGGRTSGSVWKV